jgi:hypothetical protein
MLTINIGKRYREESEPSNLNSIPDSIRLPVVHLRLMDHGWFIPGLGTGRQTWRAAGESLF